VLEFVSGRSTESERSAIDRHLDACEPCRELVSAAVRTYDASAEISESLADFATTFRPAAVVAQRYEIRRFLARGGMGEVYEAYDRHLHERVAIKTLPSAVCDSEQAIRALKAEVQLARRVTHESVCRIYDLGTHRLPTGTLLYFLTMEFVEGQTLGQMIRERGAFPIVEADRVARALLMGLGAAHRSGILHRDFKSDNIIMRTSLDGESVPVILDFGLARQLDERSRRTADRGLVGTLQYMAPEQLEGGRLYQATDIYAFGVVWFEMLTGKRPFSASPKMGVLERLRKSPTLASHYNPEIPKTVDSVLHRCLQPVPQDRFQTADEVLAALPKPAPHRTKPRRSSKLRSLHLGTAAGAGILTAITVGLLLPERRGASPAELTTQLQPNLVSSSNSAAAKPSAALTPALNTETSPASNSAAPLITQPPARTIAKVNGTHHKSARAPGSPSALASAAAPAVVPAAPTPSVSSRFRWENPVIQGSAVTGEPSATNRAQHAAGAAKF